MGILNFFKKQFIDVIDWTDEDSGVIMMRYPMQDREIQTGAKLTVRDSQLALFVDKGTVADLFEPGLHRLSTSTLPLLTNLNHWDKLFQSPFKSDVFFFSTKDQIDQRWGTANPIAVRDKEYGPIRLRAHGTYSYKVKNPKAFFKRLSGAKERYTVEELEGQLRSAILTSMGSFFGGNSISFLDMAGNQNKFSETLKTVLTPSFNDYGLALQTFFVQSISLPEELQTYLDKAAGMNMVGDLKKYAQFQTAESIQAAANNPSGGAGSGVGLGAGIAMGQAMMGNLQTPGASNASEDSTALIAKLHELLRSGAITQAEFEAKKTELLKKI